MSYIGNPPAEAYTNTVKDTFSGDGSTVAFTLSLPTTTNNVRVVVENVVQDPTVAYGVSGTTLTFTSAPPSGTNNIYVVHLGPAVQTVQPPSDLSGNFTLTGDLTQTGDYTLTGDASISGQLDTASILPITDATSSLGIGSNRYTDLFLSGGVYLGGTGAANYLDDYEEGTWTPVIADAETGGNTASLANANGYYRKIGSVVNLQVQLVNIDTTGMTGGNILYVQGLPFASNTQQAIGAALLDKITLSGSAVGYIGSSKDTLYFLENISNTPDAAITVSDVYSSGSDITASFTYFTNS